MGRKKRLWICCVFFLIWMMQNVYVYSADNVVYNEEENDTSRVYTYEMQPSLEIEQPETYYDNPPNAYAELKTPADIVQIGNMYFISDTYHNQVLYSRTLDKPIKEWYVMAKDLELPHGLAGDGTYYLVLDTERNRVCVYEWILGGFRYTQVLEDIGERPHYIRYDENEKVFYVWSSMTGDMYILAVDETIGRVCIKEVRHIYEYENQYIRSFYLFGEYIVFPSGTNQYMTIARKDTLEIVARYPVTEEIAGMAHVWYIGDYYYITVSTDLWGNQDKAKIIRTKGLEDLKDGKYEDMSYVFPSLGVPYYMEKIGGNYYLTNHGTRAYIYRFYAVENEIKEMKILY